MEYCCDRFKQDLQVNRQAQPNIRIVKIDQDVVSEINVSEPYRFIFTVGYDIKERNVPLRMIDYCPYCGIELKETYRNDKYVNETNHNFLSF